MKINLPSPHFRFSGPFPLLLSMALTLGLTACQPDVGFDNEPSSEEQAGFGEAESGDEAIGEGVEEVTALSIGNYGVAGLDSGMMLASVLLDSDARSRTGELMGGIQDLLIDGSTGNVLFAQVEHGGFLDIGDQEIMVPLNALQWDTQQTNAFTLNVDPQTFENWPALGEGWPVTTNGNWNDGIADFWNNAGVALPWNATDEMNNLVWASTLMDGGFGFDDGATVASIENLVIDLALGQARYALISPEEEGLFGNDELRAVPFTALHVSSGEANELTIQPAFSPDIVAVSPAIAANAFEGMTLFEDEWDDDLASYWAGYDYLVDSGDGDRAIGSMGATGVMGADNVMMLATEILDKEVDNVLNADLGEIEDLFIDASSGNVLFATVEHGGFLDIGDQDFPVPLTAITWNAAEEELVLPITEDLLETFPAIEDNWATTLEPGWLEVGEFWRNSNFDTRLIDQANLDTVVLASELVGYDVGAYGETGLANVNDLVIDLGKSKVQYAVVSFRDIGSYGAELLIVPFSAFDPVAFGNELVFAQEFDMDLLREAPRVAEGGFEDMNTLDPAWDDTVAGFWERAGYGIGDE